MRRLERLLSVSEQENVKELFTRSPHNPIFTPSDLPYPAKFVCNPAATEIGDDTLLLLRVTDSRTGPTCTSPARPTAWAAGASTPSRCSRPDIAPAWYDDMGCEDPRITWVPERGEYVIAYVGSSRYGAGVCLATTRDFLTVNRLGLVIHPYNKDAALFPRKIEGRYALLHRPTAGPLENIWLSQYEDEDLQDWGRPRCVLEECDQPGWDSGKVGTGPPPIETPDGWLLIFHGVQQVERGWVYRVGPGAAGQGRARAG